MWDGYLSGEEKQKMINPEKGWVSSANNALSSTHVTFKTGQYAISTGRAVAINHYIEELIERKSGEIVNEDM